MYYLGTGVTELYHFDDSGLVYLKVDDMGGETWYGYDRLVWVENERSKGYAFVHDLFGRETLRTMMGGVDCAMQYDGVGRPSRQSITRSGRPVQAYDEHGTPVWQAGYDIYGNLLNLKGDRKFVPFRQLGQYEDEETELYHNRFRYYDPSTGGYISQDPIGLEGNNPTLYAFVKDVNTEVDVFGLECSNFNGRRGENLAEFDLERNGFKIVGRQVPMTINGQSIRADFVATRNNKVYVFEAKMNSGRLTPAQKASGVFSTKKVDMANTSMSGGGTIKTSKGSSGVYIDGNGNTTNATFHVVKYKTRI